MELQDIHKEILALCVEDYTGLWLIVKRVSKDAFPLDAMPDWVRKKTIETVRDLITSTLIEAGNFEAESFRFQPMLSSTEDIVNYIQREWDEIGRAPTIGDVCWFRATAAGEQLAHELGLGD